MATLQQLEERITKLEGESQLTYPLDIISQTIINSKKFKFEAEETGTTTADKTLRVSIDGKIYQINVL
jgi:hypothetical protein